MLDDQESLMISLQDMSAYIRRITLQVHCSKQSQKIEMLDNLTNFIHHDFRNPLHTSLQFLQVVKQQSLKNKTVKNMVKLLNCQYMLIQNKM